MHTSSFGPPMDHTTRDPQVRVERIRALNDEFRTAGPDADQPAEWFSTPGVVELGDWFLRRAIEEVIRFDAFDEDNDPHGEHDFGAFSVMDERCFWKIDCYDRTMEAGSPDPADAAVTTRVMTLLLASEY